MLEASLLLKNATILDPVSQLNGTRSDIFIQNGIIQKIASNLSSKADRVINCEGLIVCPSFVDLRAHVDEPGNEHKETIESLCNVAAAGGFTKLAVLPETDPPTQSKSAVKYLKNQSAEHLVDLLPLGASTEDLNGQELTELYDMKLAGAIGFSNGNKPYSKANVLYKILQYASNFDLPVFSHAEDKDLAQEGMVNESATTVHTGLKYRPAIAEYSRVQQEIEVAKYANCAIHFSHISSAQSVDIIRQAKKEGLPVSCDVSILHLVLNDEAVLNFDTRTKVLPPLRSENDRLELIKGLKDGTIDAICSDHRPQNQENKLVEYDYASFGATTLQSFFANLWSLRNEGLSDEVIIAKCSSGPREILGLDKVNIESGMPAEIAIFDPSEIWTLDKSNNKSLSENSPFWGTELQGRCKAIISSEKIIEF